MNRMREIRNQWSQEDWKRDIARYEDCRAKLARNTGLHFLKLREHWKKACNEIAERYPSAKLDRFE